MDEDTQGQEASEEHGRNSHASLSDSYKYTLLLNYYNVVGIVCKRHTKLR